jgi:hypothetical protein
MSRTIALFLVALLVAACDSQKTAPSGSDKPAATPPAGGTASTPAATTSTPVKATADDTAASVSKAAASATDASKTTAKESDITSALESAVDVEKFKQLVASWTPASLQAIGAKAVESIQKHKETLASLKEQLSKLGVTDTLKTAELTKKVTDTGAVIKGLQDKLKVVIDQLKAGGQDVSKLLPGLAS